MLNDVLDAGKYRGHIGGIIAHAWRIEQIVLLPYRQRCQIRENHVRMGHIYSNVISAFTGEGQDHIHRLIDICVICSCFDQPVEYEPCSLFLVVRRRRDCREGFQKSQMRLRYFPRVATLTVNYADGKARKVPIRYNMEINDWNAIAGGCGCRMVVRGNAEGGENYAIYAFDWNNPRPKAKITTVELSTEKLPASLL